MNNIVQNEAELASALKRHESIIIVEGDLVQKVVRIKATGKLAWTIALGGIAIAGYAAYLSSAAIGGGAAATGAAATGAAATGAAATGAISFGSAILPVAAPVAVGAGAAGAATLSILGIPATIAAISIAVAAGGTKILGDLRSYKIKERSSQRIVLTR